MHVSIYASPCGLSAEQVGELTHGAGWDRLTPSLWSASERLIVRMVDELHHHATVSDETWQALSATWPQDQVIELIFASSFYHMAAFFLNAAAVPLEDGAARFVPPMAQASVSA
jgi:hypothetical protein